MWARLQLGAGMFYGSSAVLSVVSALRGRRATWRWNELMGPSTMRGLGVLDTVAAKPLPRRGAQRRERASKRRKFMPKTACIRYPWLLGAPLVVLRALRGATGGASEWRPPLAWCQEVLRNPYAHHGGRLQLPERGPRTKGALGKFLRFAQVTTPGPVVGGTTSRPARMRGRWTDSSSSRARALLTAARALQQECRKPQCGIVRLPHRAAAAPLLLGHHRELGGPLRGRGQHRAGSLLRAGADRGCGLKALPADLWPGACQTAGPNTPALARATAPGAGWDISS